jgi:putative spermidine/putrescine transport system permease protein
VLNSMRHARHRRSTLGANRPGGWGWRALWLIFIGCPMAWGTCYAIAFSLGGVGRLSSGWTLAHWSQAFSEPTVVGALGHSLVVALVATALIVVGSLGTLLIQPKIRHSPSLLFALVVLMGTPALVLGQMLGTVLGSGGWLSRLAFHSGWLASASEFPPLVNDRWSLGMTAGITLSLVPLALLYFSQLWSAAKIDRCCQLAQSLGGTAWDARWRVALPMLLWRGKSLIVLVFILALGSYEIPLLLGRQSPQMFSVATQRLAVGFDLGLKPQAFVLAVIYLLCTSLMLVWYIRARHTSHE